MYLNAKKCLYSVFWVVKRILMYCYFLRFDYPTEQPTEQPTINKCFFIFIH